MSTRPASEPENRRSASGTEFGPETLLTRLRALPRAERYVIAYSGGCDSTALVHAMAALRAALAPAPVEAAHVHHGLGEAAGAWERHCAEACRALGLELHACRVEVDPRAGGGVEAAARERRYAALAALLGPHDALVTAHHADDQAETVLLRLLRGSAPQGLRGMPAQRPLGRGRLLRPLLGVTRAALRRYAESRSLRWVDDPSNADPSFDRAYLRAEVVPRLEARWPALAATLGRTARHQGESASLAAALGAADLDAARGSDGDGLSCEALLGLESSRARNLLRAWLASLGFEAPGAKRLEALLAAAGAGADRSPMVRWRGVEVRRYRGELRAMRPLAPAPAAGLRVDWRPPEPVALAGGRLVVEPVIGEGLRPGVLADAGVAVGFRSGGERCRLAGSAHSRPLKKIMQERRVPPWIRARTPLVYVDGALAAVAGLGVCAGFEARSGEPGWRLRFEPRHE